MGLFSNRIERSSLKPGDHIYSWRSGYVYAHHGIYVGDNKVIHFTRRGQELGTGSLDLFLVSSGPSLSHVPCPTCVPVEEGHGVVSSCLDCFLAGGILYRFEYSVNPALFLAKVRGGTCTLAVADDDDAVIHRAKCLLDNGFGCYDLFKKNCEDFAIHCKTGLPVLNQNRSGQSGQITSLFGGVTIAGSFMTGLAIAAALPSIPVTVPAMAINAVVVYYCVSRYINDIGRKRDVSRASAEEDLPRGQAAGSKDSPCDDTIKSQKEKRS